MKDKPVLAGLLPEQLKELLPAYPAFRSAQIYEWICRGALSFDEMSNLPVSLRGELATQFELVSGGLHTELRDGDGTVKLGLKLADGAIIETVILNDGKGRKTACLSTQAGCPIGCVFCKTGMIGFKRNLTAAEIAGQFLHLRRRESGISHIVIMGMGEPLLNLDELRRALDFFSDPGGLNISKRRITLSTNGIEKGLIDLADNGPDIRLALSLTTAREELRKRLMPGSDPLPGLRRALLAWQKKRKRRVTLEMVLLGGINTGPADAKACAAFAAGLDAVINLIPWNPVENVHFEGSRLRTPPVKETLEFAKALEGLELKVTRRREKGLGIAGACGQLGTALAFLPSLI
ncbi:MAG: 23S rRNA (adenine(2503)-C(2))-methyltransferase RlmN [Treponema sp.]|jgi:23S rRNA (adenine2503-C2)-methyltransferase|nr:23S rRNA (adenine(2503)-C(2))-methyltransferase RlmN [Treponema sp.]